MKKYKHQPITESVEIAVLARALLDEIKFAYRPLFEFVSNQDLIQTIDHFNPIKILMPLVEVSSKIEFNGEAPLLLTYLKIPKPEIIWHMFRHGLSHYVRPFYVEIDGQRINWAVPQYPCNYYDTADAIGIYAPKLLNDLEAYLYKFRYNQNIIRIQTGIKLFNPSPDASQNEHL